MTWQTRKGPHLSGCPRIVCAAALFLAGCSSGGGSIATGSLVGTMKGAFHGFGIAPLTREDVQAVPFASIGYNVGDNSEQMLVLAGQQSGELVWTSSAKITLVTLNGRVVRTIGLQHDLTALTLTQSAAPVHRIGAISVWSIRLDDPDEEVGSMRCVIQSAEPETILVLQRQRHTIRIHEVCTSPELRWRFENQYWTDETTGILWRSVQHTNPKLQALTTELLRPYAPDDGARPADAD